MSKKTINTLVKKSGKTSLKKMADSVIFKPSPIQNRIKIKFWKKFEGSPFAGGEEPSLTLALQMTGASSLKEWWPLDGFKEWFFNKTEALEKTEYLYLTALDTLEDILRNPEAQASARVNAAKLVFEAADKMPSRYKEKYADEQVGKMDQKQLEGLLDGYMVDYIKQKGLKIVEEKILTVPAEDVTEKGRDNAEEESNN